MGIRDWGSDVCSSDLRVEVAVARDARLLPCHEGAVHRRREALLGPPLRLGDRLEPRVSHAAPLVCDQVGIIIAPSVKVDISAGATARDLPLGAGAGRARALR